MKKRSFFVLAASTVLFAYACSKSNEPPKEEEEKKPLVTAPEASVVHDGKSGGVYKGVIIGSTGTVKIILQDGTVSAEVTIDGTTKVLAPQNLPAGWASGQALNEVIFKSDNWTLTFSVAANGGQPNISAVSIPGHTDVAVSIIKEESTTLVKVFEGGLGRDSLNLDLGTVNFVIRSVGDSVWGIYQKQAQRKQPIYGHYLLNEEISLLTDFNRDSLYFSARATLNGDKIGGKWTIFSQKYDRSGSDSGYWKAQRTL